MSSARSALRADVGAFDASGNYWITQSNTSDAYEVKAATISSGSPVATTVPFLNNTFLPADWSLDGGYLWGLRKTTLYRVTIAGSGVGTVLTYPAPAAVASVGNANPVFGAAWTFSNGNLGFSNNATGWIYEIKVNTPATPTFSVVSSFIGPVAGDVNDGASCLGKPTDMSIVKTGPTTVTAGGTVTWVITVTNNGPGNSSGYVVNDPVPAGVTGVATSTPGCAVVGNNVQCTEGVLDSGDTFNIILTGTAPDKTDSCFTNTASVIGNESDPNAKNNSSSVQTCTTPGISLVKTASITAYSSAGTLVTYTYNVTNTSTNTALTNVTVTDPMTGLSAINCGSNTNVISVLNAGASQVCTATYTTTTADVTAGSIANTGTATGTPPSGPAISAESSVTILAVQVPALSIYKTANVTSFSAAGQSITYSYTVTNTGNVTLTNVTVTDPMAGLSAINCGSNSNVIPSLAPGASVTCTATYVTTGANLKNGSINNVGTATGVGPNKKVVKASSSLTVPAPDQPFVCTTPTDFLSQTNSNTNGAPTQLYYSTPNFYTYQKLGPLFPKTYNALGWDTVSGNEYLYATIAGTNDMIQIDSAGAVISTHAIAGYAAGPGPAVGAFDSSGNYWITEGGGLSANAYEIKSASILSGSPSATVVPLLKNKFEADDWSLDDGYLWGLEGKTIYRVTITGAGIGTVDTYPAPPAVASIGGPNPTFGAAWTFSNGNLGFSNNVTGWIYQISVATPATPTFAVVSSFIGPTGLRINDGASCLGQPTDLNIVKTGPPTVTAGGTMTWVITVTNNGPGNSSGFTVNDPVPSGVTGVATSTPGCSITSNKLQCIEGTLDAGNSFNIILTGTAPSVDRFLLHQHGERRRQRDRLEREERHLTCPDVYDERRRRQEDGQRQDVLRSGRHHRLPVRRHRSTSDRGTD